jgi:hypothetical protein
MCRHLSPITPRETISRVEVMAIRIIMVMALAAEAAGEEEEALAETEEALEALVARVDLPP